MEKIENVPESSPIGTNTKNEDQKNYNVEIVSDSEMKSFISDLNYNKRKRLEEDHKDFVDQAQKGKISLKISQEVLNEIEKYKIKLPDIHYDLDSGMYYLFTWTKKPLLNGFVIAEWEEEFFKLNSHLTYKDETKDGYLRMKWVWLYIEATLEKLNLPAKEMQVEFFKRRSRAKNQRIFLMDVTGNVEEKRVIFKILGSTGDKEYDVILEHKKPAICPCYDAKIRNSQCKHLIFVHELVLKVHVNELLRNFKECPDSTIQAAMNLLLNYQSNPDQIKSGEGSKLWHANEEIKVSKDIYSIEEDKIKNLNDTCGICYEDMVVPKSDQEKMLDIRLFSYCPTCSRICHYECWKTYYHYAKKQWNKVHCIYCRQPKDY
jgi:hypothetical protein